MQKKKLTTKREILSDVASIYDPLGWIAPTTFKAKHIMKGICLLERNNKKYEWEQMLPDSVINEWHQFKTILPKVNEFEIPRWLGVNEKSKVELHGFCDASGLGYAAVIYVRRIDEQDIDVKSLILN